MAVNRQEVAKNVLIGLGVVGIVVVAVVAPGLVKAIPSLSKVDFPRINRELKRLKDRGLVEIIKRRSGLVSVKLTKAGRDKIKTYQVDSLVINKQVNWDKKWRIIIFDVPVQKNSSRERLRKKMKRLGFFSLQKSVYVHAYPCFEVVEFLRNYLGIKAEVEYIEADKLESQDKLVSHFFT